MNIFIRVNDRICGACEDAWVGGCSKRNCTMCEVYHEKEMLPFISSRSRSSVEGHQNNTGKKNCFFHLSNTKYVIESDPIRSVVAGKRCDKIVDNYNKKFKIERKLL